jgi:hypothetical protein
MIKFIQKFLIVLSFITVGVANATLITEDLTEDNYATIGQLDWAWASVINSNGVAQNEIFGPKDVFDEDVLDVTWRVAEETELLSFITLIKSNPEYYLDLFTLKDDLGNILYDDQNRVQYKHAIPFWNSAYEDVYSGSGGNVDNFKAGYIKSNVSIYQGVPGSFNPFAPVPTDWYFETFYVRNTPAQVPEPSTIMIFAIALIALSMRKRLIK